MKVRVTYLKAPWPKGTEPGDVVEVGDAVPQWAVGKCEPVAEEAAEPAPTKPGKAKK